MAALPAELQPELQHALNSALADEITACRAVSGGDINRAYAVTTRNGEDYFLKVNDASLAAMFSAELEALNEIGGSDTVRVPAPIVTGATDTHAWLVLEWLDLQTADAAADDALGCSLAAMHRHSSATFGWHRDNTIGSTPQSNRRHTDWVSFYRDERLFPQLELAGLLTQGAQLLERLDDFFPDDRPVPALLHGDLWGGNRAVLADGAPVIFDPATYYGDREADIAMTRLFGSFNERFYSAYNEAWPLETGHERRQVLYNLYHVLNHCNLFGGSYRRQAESMIQQLLH